VEAALVEALPMSEETAALVEALKETQQVQVALETRLLRVQAKETTVDQHHHFPAALAVAVQTQLPG
jgi:energy-coupling factor transporter transmembrane protein EcfT